MDLCESYKYGVLRQKCNYEFHRFFIFKLQDFNVVCGKLREKIQSIIAQVMK